MISGALVAAFLSSLAWAGLDVARKSLARDLRPIVAATGLTAGTTVGFGAWLAVSRPAMQVESYLVPALISIVLASGVQLLIIESMRVSELSRTIPLLSFTPVATMLFGVVVLRELPSTVQWLGIGLVLVGGVGLGLSRMREGGGMLTFDRGSAMMLGAAVLISAAAPFDKLALRASSVEAHGFLQSAGIGVLLTVLLVVRGNLGDLRDLGRSFRARPLLAIAGLIALAAIGLQFAAYRGAMVGIVETIKRVIGMASSLIAGYLVFGETVSAGKLGALATMGLGVTLILLY